MPERTKALLFDTTEVLDAEISLNKAHLVIGVGLGDLLQDVRDRASDPGPETFGENSDRCHVLPLCPALGSNEDALRAQGMPRGCPCN